MSLKSVKFFTYLILISSVNADLWDWNWNWEWDWEEILFDDSKVTLEYKWNYLNFTWPSYETYLDSYNNEEYIPQHNLISGIKFYNGITYVSLPRYRNGTPATLATIPRRSPKENPLLKPFPSWEMNVKLDNCSTLQSVQNIEIDTKGIMWILDGVRINGISTNCPAKLVFMDLNKNAEIIGVYNFDDSIAGQDGALLDDLVIDESDGGYAYISDGSANPGLIIYSRKENKAWKVFDTNSMLYETNATTFEWHDKNITFQGPINGIALSPKSAEEKYFYYSALTSYDLYRIPTNALKDEELCQTGKWIDEIECVGKKQCGQGDGMAMDSKGTLYYSLVCEHGIGKWNSKKNFRESKIIYKNNETLYWPDAISFDNKHSVYFTSNRNIYDLFNATIPVELNVKEYQCYVNKLKTGTKSYLF